MDDKGRLKVPTAFRPLIQDVYGPDVFITSLTGECARIYPMPVWLEVQARLRNMPSNHPTREKFLDLISYFGQTAELDAQGRIVISPLLRESASIVGDVRVVGRLDHLEVWNDDLFKQRVQGNPWTSNDGLSLAEYGV